MGSFTRIQTYLPALLILLLLPAVQAIASTPGRFVGVSEAQVLSSTTDAACQISGVCSDSVYSSISDAYTVLGDGSTSASSTVTIRNTTNTQSAVLSITYDIEGLRDGDYYLRLFFTSKTAGTIYVFPYINDTSVDVNYVGSLVVTGTSNQWVEVPITPVVERSFNVSSRVKLRVVASQSGAQSIGEAYLKQPPTAGDFQLVPQGTNIGRINSTVENEWKMVTQVASYTVSNPTCVVRGIDQNHLLINSTEINLVTELGDQVLVVSWFTNSSAGIVEGHNYEVSCEAQFDGVYITDIEQYVYITAEKTMGDYFQQLLAWVLQIFGFTQHTDSLVTNLAAEVQVLQIDGFVGENQTVNVALLYNNTYLTNVTGIGCNATVYNPNGSTYALVPLTYSVAYDSGQYIGSVILPYERGSYRVRANCGGGALGNITASGYETWHVSDDKYRMSVIS